MSKRFWLLGLAGLVLVALLVACGNGYNPSRDGLVVVGSQGSGLLETFSFNLNSGGVTAIANSPNDTASQTCVLSGLPGSMVMGPSGTYAYVILVKSTQCANATQYGIGIFQVKSDGTIAQVGSPVPFANETPNAPVVPNTISIDAAGKFLFVADRATIDSTTQLPVPGAVSVFAIGSGGTLTEVPGSPFVIPTGIQPVNPDIVSVAASPTVFPNVGINNTQNSVCQTIPGSPPPTAQYLYAVDTVNYGVWEFSVNTTTGALGNPPNTGAPQFVASDKVPMGVAVDPCDRFVYVSDSLTNKISAYLLCSVAVIPTCPYADGSLKEIVGSPITMSGSVAAPGPIVVDPFGNNVYVVGTQSNTVSAFAISPVTGALKAATPPTVATGRQPISIVIRGDNNWMFVTNFIDATVSQYAVVPVSGTLSALPAIQTDNSPWGVAVR